MNNLRCQKRRHIVVRNKNGQTGEKFRCANGASCMYRDTVDELTCKQCCLRQPLVCAAARNEPPPVNPLWPEPQYNNQSEVVYPISGKTDAPPPPQGYSHKIQAGTTSWRYKSNWGVCLYQQFMNRRGEQGDLQVIAHCSAQKGRVVSHAECLKCQQATEEVGGLLSKRAVEEASPLPEKDSPEYPAAVKQLKNYYLAVERWVRAGRPVRSNKEVKAIHTDFCVKCDWHDPKQHRCKGCGCKVRPNGIAVLNKIKMATENCPQKLW